MMILILIFFFLLSTWLAYFLISHEHGPRKPIWSIISSVLSGALSFGLASGVEYVLFQSGQKNLTIYYALLAGVIEEIAKFTFLALYISGKPYFDELTDGVVYFGICGLTFGLIENLLYTLGGGTRVGVERLFFTPFFHAATCGIIGYYFARWKLSISKAGLIINAILVMVLLHASYDYFLGYQTTVIISYFITLGLSCALFLFYQQAHIIDVGMRLSIDRPNNYCIFCGSPNPNHYRYCTHCGRHLY